MSKVDILFLNNKAMEELGCGDMAAVMHDVERAYTLVEQGDVITPGKLPMRWGKTAEAMAAIGRTGFDKSKLFYPTPQTELNSNRLAK